MSKLIAVGRPGTSTFRQLNVHFLWAFSAQTLILPPAREPEIRGTPVNTFDLDVVYERSAANIARLLHALDELQAIVRDDPRRLRLNESHLQSPGHKLMETNQGPLDLLGTIEETAGFPELVADSDWIDLGTTRARAEPVSELQEARKSEQAGLAT